MNDPLRSVFDFVTEHNLVTLLLLLVLSGGVVAGASQLQLTSEADATGAAGDTEVAETLTYIQDNYGPGGGQNGTDTEPAAVYVRAEDNALSKAALLDSLRFQQAVRENESVAAALGDREVVGVANLVAVRAAGDPGAGLEEQTAALEAASASEVERLVEQTLTEGSPALELLPEGYEPGTASAESHRMVFRFAETGDRSAATAVLYETADQRQSPEYFTAGEHASAEANAQYMGNTMGLVVPVALLLILLVLAFSYRDLVDILVGFTGVVLSVLWMFGILGWLGIPAGMSLIIGPVLIVGLSVDYGLHVFMRYREERGQDESIHDPMARGLTSLVAALGLVTLTAVVGFLSNTANELAVIRQLGVAISLGVVSTFVVSVTLVPALKVTVDGLLERVGLDRRKAPLGKTGWLEGVLRRGASLARRAAPVVVVLALVVGAAGAVAWADLDRQSVQQGDGGVAEWKQDLPGPLAWEVAEEANEQAYVADHYRAADEDARSRSNVLVEGAVTDPAALEAVQAVHETASETAVVYQQSGSGATPVTSPLTVMAAVAEEDPAFAETLAAADTDDDGVPDRNLEGVYDALYAAAPDRASQVIDQAGTAGDGDAAGAEYRSLRVVVPVQPDATITVQADGMHSLAAAADGYDGVSATAAGSATLQEAGLSQTADSILMTLVLALGAVGVLLTLVYRLVAGSASLGAVTAVPVTLVTALVVGGMWLFEVPLTLLTALLLSLVIGVGIDYNIHVSDRFVHERERGRSVHDALVEATTGTGGALLGSTLTSAGAFSALLLHPHPQFQSFGTLVVLAMVTSFVVAVFVLPSMLALWTRYGPASVDADAATDGVAIADD
jgi:predicted RND superfamily exporter protein